MPRPAAETLERTRRFWNASPCGAQDTFSQRYEHRYAVEPWVLDLLRLIANRHTRVLEIGCGQGTDGIVLCSLLPTNGDYVGIDYSDESVAAAIRSAREAESSLGLNIRPTFRRGNAERLDMADNSVDCVYSNGVLHHTPNTQHAFDEVWRVLRPGGEAFITLYRKPSPKVGLAKLLRGIQSLVDALLRRDRSLYRLIEGRRMPSLLGTMLQEGFGVPVLRWYSRRDIVNIFNNFGILRAAAVGCNIPRRNPTSRGWTRWGYMWFVHLQKPQQPNQA